MEITELKKDLAATFRWTARLNMNEGVANHFSACVPGSTDEFLVNKSGVHFSQMKVSDLILVTKENIEELKKKPDLVDATAINIHGTIHQKVPHAKCIFHVHSKYATALSALKNPTLPPIDQNTMRFYNRVSIYNEYKNAKIVTQERMYLETMEKVLADIDKVIIEKNAGSGVVPYLPLPELKKKATN